MSQTLVIWQGHGAQVYKPEQPGKVQAAKNGKRVGVMGLTPPFLSSLPNSMGSKGWAGGEGDDAQR